MYASVIYLDVDDHDDNDYCRQSSEQTGGVTQFFLQESQLVKHGVTNQPHQSQ